MALLSYQNLAFTFGLFGNIVSFLVFLAPVPTFYKIYQRKSSTGYQPIPYSVAFFSASLLLYYAYLKTNAYMIISINGFGCLIEVVYLYIFLFYATRASKISTGKWIVGFNGGGLGLVVAVSLLVHGPERVSLLGWTCAVVNVAVFASPLSIMRQVIRTKSVQFMPFSLSFFLTLCATMWFFYGFFVRDFYIAVPNILGFLLGIAQMILYFIYKDENEICGDGHYEKGGTNNDIEMETSCDHFSANANAEKKLEARNEHEQ